MRQRRRGYSFLLGYDAEVLNKLNALARMRGLKKLDVLRTLITKEWWRHERGLDWVGKKIAMSGSVQRDPGKA